MEVKIDESQIGVVGKTPDNVHENPSTPQKHSVSGV
jgi:hypothetical protein